MDFAEKRLADRGVPVERHCFHENRIHDYHGVNLYGVLEGARPGPTVLLNGHMDTVKLCEGWTRDPYSGEIEGDRMYGLGACDMKAGSAGIMLALERFLQKKGSEFAGKIVYSLVCDEEGPFGLGTDALIVDGILSGDADVAVIPEPSSAFADVAYPSIALGARGGWNYRVTLHGASCHGAQPEQGINAVSEAARVLLELEKTELPPHEKLGSGSICCVEFHGGGAALSVPDEASFSIFRHVTVGEDKEVLQREVDEAVERAGIRGTAEMHFRDAPHADCDGFPAYVTDEKDAYVASMQRTIKGVTGKEPQITYFDSVGDFCYTGGRLHVPTLVVGPKGANYHAADEYVELSTAVQSANVLLEFLERMVG
ncbi:MAG: M20/M25/M40 family metallo-hydrolase [Synergistales bacterium]|nr:M20/M25/M40 family metallo-hydrolase [Synergistales bacterium]